MAPGLEDVARAEVEALPDVSDIAAETGGVAWTGPPASGYRANLWSRVATRVLARVGDFEAREFGKLRHRAARLPWHLFVPGGASVAARASASHCRLYHTGALSEAAVLAVSAGCDGILICSGDHATQTAALEALIYAVESGELPLARVDDALKRQQRAKEGFLTATVGSRPLEGKALRQRLGRDEHRVIADEMARFL